MKSKIVNDFFTLSNMTKHLIKKDIILYHPHRQTLPIVTNTINKKNHIFINVTYFWKAIPLKSKYKLKYSLMYALLSIISPRYILNVSWISKWDSLYKVWTLHHSNSKFIVLQHGAGIGGIRTRYRSTKCDILLTWGDFFTNQYKFFNKGKRVKVLSFGNPVYNLFSRDDYTYHNKVGGRLLIAPSAVEDHRLKHLYCLTQKLIRLGFDIILKEHNHQGRQNKEYNFPPIIGITKTTGNIYDILQNNDFDMIISDHSTVLLDSIYFKNKTIFFSPESNIIEYTDNLYSKYLKNVFYFFDQFTKSEDLYEFVDIEAQERLLATAILKGNNVLNDYL